MLATLIALFGPISGAHFNPAVSIVEALRGKLTLQQTLAYVAVQIVGCCVGALLAHAMFELPLIQTSMHLRTGPAQWLSEGVASAGLILVVMGCSSPNEAAWRVAAWIGAAYWFTASTSFANPAITIARSLTNTFSGIRPIDAPAFILAQLAGALGALGICRHLFPPPDEIAKFGRGIHRTCAPHRPDFVARDPFQRPRRTGADAQERIRAHLESRANLGQRWHRGERPAALPDNPTPASDPR